MIAVPLFVLLRNHCVGVAEDYAPVGAGLDHVTPIRTLPPLGHELVPRIDHAGETGLELLPQMKILCHGRARFSHL